MLYKILKKEMFKLKTLQWVSDNGLYFCFSETQPFFLSQNLRTSIGAIVQVNKSPLQDGANTSNAVLDQLQLKISAAIKCLGNSGLTASRVKDETVNILNQAFSPKTFGTLYYNNARGSQFIRARPITTPAIIEEPSCTNIIRVEVELISDDSYWSDTSDNEQRIGFSTGKLTFPFSLPLIFGEYSNESTIINPTTLEANTIIEIMTTSDKIKVENKTSRNFVEVERPIAENQKMIIDSKRAVVELWEKDEYGVFHFEEDASNWLGLKSDMIKLLPGENILSIENQGSYGIPVAVIKWHNPIMGV